ncbi:MAG: cobalamin-dependent protein [Proteobacteria bacterium]|nr:cobalamin-dependent protein [Pseudomonadota bacterium]
MTSPLALIINPWIYDFAAFDLWARPLGALYLAAWLRTAGWEVRLVDCLDRLHPDSMAPAAKKRWTPGTGQWRREVLPTPSPLAGLPRRYARYGLPIPAFNRLVQAPPAPDVVLVTSSMTYWYPGVRRAVTQVRQAWPEVPVVLGGAYATLCPDHARRVSGADVVVQGPGESALPRVLAELTGIDPGPPPAWTSLRPALDLYPRLEFAPLLTSRGCPYHCPYCASNRLYPGFTPRDPDDVLDEIEDRAVRLGLSHFTFFDDALLVDAHRRLVPILETVIRRFPGLSFHAPNGLHLGLIDRDMAELMRAAGFKTLRLGLETLDMERQAAMGGKVGPGQFETALAHLKAAGFDPARIGVYILCGLPGQDWGEPLAAARAVRALGARPFLAEYAPLPGTPLWQETLRHSEFDLAAEPLYHNNSFFACRGKNFSWEKVREIKRAALA